MPRHALITALRDAHLPRTQTRMLVLTELARTGPAARTAQDVHAALRQQGALLPFSTTYRVFLALADKGLIVPAAEDAGRPAFRLNTELMLQVARPNL